MIFQFMLTKNKVHVFIIIFIYSIATSFKTLYIIFCTIICTFFTYNQFVLVQLL
jgi:hypothetical protein